MAIVRELSVNSMGDARREVQGNWSVFHSLEVVELLYSMQICIISLILTLISPSKGSCYQAMKNVMFDILYFIINSCNLVHATHILFYPCFRQHSTWLLLKAFWTENKHLNSWLLLKCHQNPYLSSDCTCKAEWRSFISTLWFARPAIVNHGGQITTPGTLWPILWTVCGVYSHNILIAICVLVILQLLWQRWKRNIVLIDCAVKIKYWQIVTKKRLL